ncbi:MAG: NADPH-dependent glutamate synthase [Bacilli bacterium]|nr:NADPH-dependent glutamate synthase [Bacilli bacterium]
MARMTPDKHPMPTQDPVVRAQNFKEVATGYTAEMAVEEAERCLHCPTQPCVNGCPVHIHIPDFIERIKNKDFEGAYKVISQSSSLPAVCGRVCPQESQCECYCIRGKGSLPKKDADGKIVKDENGKPVMIKSEAVGIGRLERFVADWHLANSTEKPEKPVPNGHKVAVIGSGPSGLTCAGDLAKLGFKVTVFEALHVAGGVLVYGIPEFRLPKSIVQKEVDNLKALDVDIETNVVIGRTLTIDELFEDGYEAVYIGSGAGLPKFMNIPGEGLKGVLSANEFLTRINLMKAYKEGSDTPVAHSKKVAVIGGGNVAMDAARSAKRLGGDVTIVYRRTKEELPARAEEVEHAMEEGIKFAFLTNPTRINGDDKGNVTSITCIKMELGEPDASGRRRPVEIPNSEFDMEMDEVIMSLGTSPNPLIKSTTKGLDTQRWGGIVADEETGHTSRDHVYAGGDAVTGAATVILAMGAGKKAAAAIAKELLPE